MLHHQIPKLKKIRRKHMLLKRKLKFNELASAPRLRKTRRHKTRSIKSFLRCLRNQKTSRRMIKVAIPKHLPVFRIAGMKQSKSRINWPNVSNYSSSASTRAAIASSRKVATLGITSGSTQAKDHFSAQNVQKHSLKAEILVVIWRTSTKFQEVKFLNLIQR